MHFFVQFSWKFLQTVSLFLILSVTLRFPEHHNQILLQCIQYILFRKTLNEAKISWKMHHFFWCWNAAGFGVRHGRYLAADSSGMEMKHGITKQNYCRGLGSQTVTAETRNWTEHKRYAPRYVRTWRGKESALRSSRAAHKYFGSYICHTFAISIHAFAILPYDSMNSQISGYLHKSI